MNFRLFLLILATSIPASAVASANDCNDHLSPREFSFPHSILSADGMLTSVHSESEYQVEQALYFALEMTRTYLSSGVLPGEYENYTPSNAMRLALNSDRTEPLAYQIAKNVLFPMAQIDFHAETDILENQMRAMELNGVRLLFSPEQGMAARRLRAYEALAQWYGVQWNPSKAYDSKTASASLLTPEAFEDYVLLKPHQQEVANKIIMYWAIVFRDWKFSQN